MKKETKQILFMFLFALLFCHSIPTQKLPTKSQIISNRFVGYMQEAGNELSSSQPITDDSELNFDDYGLGSLTAAGTEVDKFADSEKNVPATLMQEARNINSTGNTFIGYDSKASGGAYTHVSNGVDSDGKIKDVSTLESSLLRLEVQKAPYFYQVIEKSSGQIILSQAGTQFNMGNTTYSTKNISNLNVTGNTLTGDIGLNETPETVQVSFNFAASNRLEVILTGTGSTVNIKEIFKDQGEHYYGIWEYPVGQDIDNRGADRQLLGFETEPHNNYSSARAPFYVTSRKYGIYAESMALGHYTIAVNNQTSFAFDTSELKYHIIYGPQYKDVLYEYNQLAGPSFMPPDWAFSTIWWRDDDHRDFGPGVNNSQENVLDTANKLIEHKIPASAIWIDRPYSSGDRGWGNMDFDSTFPDPQGMINELNTKGYNLLLWIANRTRNRLYDEGLANDYLLYGPRVWPVSGNKCGPAADMKNPDAYKWFQSNLDIYAKMGVKGYKIDRGDEGGMPDSVQNEMVYLFHKMASEGQKDRHGNDHLIFARNVYDKSRQHVGVWSGDPKSDFGGLAISIKNALRCGAINFPFNGADVGGYQGDNIPKELFARWFQLGTYSSMMEVLIDPGRVVWYDYDQEMIEIARKQCQDHHHLIPYTRSYMYQAIQTGMPIMRQLNFEYPDDTSLYNMWDEYLYGGEILVAPIYNDGARSRSVYLPKGRWLDYNDKKTSYTGTATINVNAPLDTIPLFVKEGAIIPKGDIVKVNNFWTDDWHPNLNIEFFPAINGKSTFKYYTGNKVVPITCVKSGRNIIVTFDDLGIDGNLHIYAKGYSFISKNGKLLTPGSDFIYNTKQKVFSVPFKGNTKIIINGTDSIFGKRNPTSTPVQHAPLAPDHLTVDDKIDPMGVHQPYFGWYVNDPDDNEIQTKYRLIVASSHENIDADYGDIWDTGEVISDRQNHIKYNGPALSSNTRYYWKVKTWDISNNEGPFSESAQFDIGLLSNDDWSGAKWIKRDSSDNDDYTYYRKKFITSDLPIKRATVYISACHKYELYLNGNLVGKGPVYHYPQYQYYNTFDITKNLIRNQSNGFAILHHWFGGGQGRPAGERGIILKAVIEYDDNSVLTIATDSNWRQHEADCWVDGMGQRQSGEGVGYIDKIDARYFMDDWHQLDFDDTDWANATEIGAHPVSPWTGTLQPDLTRVIENEITPVSVTHIEGGKYVIDLGKVYAGIPKITFSGGAPGTIINMRGGYTLNSDGEVSTSTTQSTDMSYYYVLDGGTGTFQPMEYLGMRYFQVDNAPNSLTQSNVKFIARHYELNQTRSSFFSSNPTLNQVWDLMKHSLLCGAQEQYVDTPTREKGGFLGDAWAQSASAMLVYGERNLTLRMLNEFLQSQDQYWSDGRLNAVYPNKDGKRDIPDYTQAFLVWVWDYYMNTGDIDFLKQHYNRLKMIAEYVDSYKNSSTGLIHNLAGGSGQYQYGIIDWPQNMRYGYDMDTISRTVINAYAYINFNIISKIASAVGNSGDRDLYAIKANQLKNSINSKLLNSNGVYVDGLDSSFNQSIHVSQHANMFPMAMGIVPDDNYPNVIQAIKEKKISCGMFPIRWLVEAIGEVDEGAHLIEMYTNVNWDGWANILSQGATCTWEEWSGDGSQSMSHAWGAAGLIGYIKYILGVKPVNPQFSKIVIKPLDFDGVLNNISGTVPTDRGDISICWQQASNQYSMNLSIPDNIQARIYVPIGSGIGTDILVNNVLYSGTIEGKYIYIDVGSGNYSIVRSAYSRSIRDNF